MACHDLLLGRWTGEGSGEYPTIEPFEYRETLVIEAVPGRPFATWVSSTVDAGSGEPRHRESGYLRPAAGGCELVLAHAFGITEIAVSGPPTDGRYRFESTSIAGSPTAKSVLRVVRTIDAGDDTLGYTIAMAAVGHPLTHHLRAALTRA